MTTPALQIMPIASSHEFVEGDRVAARLAGDALRTGTPILDGDVIVVTQKIVSKVEGRIVAATPADKDALVRSESRRVLRERDGMMITETHHGFVCANAGIDFSNMPEGTAALLPIDADRSAQRIRAELLATQGLNVAIIVSDTFGRPWRRGLVDIAIGCAGIVALHDLRGQRDALGRELEVTEIAIADELAAAAELVMGKTSGIPAAIIRGVPAEWLAIDGRVQRDIVRPPDEDLFR
ncbi:MAG: coenzyme F420-0:L-glutamate ligase [Acidimicrobiia bacterium]